MYVVAYETSSKKKKKKKKLSGHGLSTDIVHNFFLLKLKVEGRGTKMFMVFFMFFAFHLYTFVRGCKLWFRIAMQCACIKLVSLFCGNVISNNLLSTHRWLLLLYLFIVPDVPYFNWTFVLTEGPILDLLGTRLPPHRPPFLTCLGWSWSKLTTSRGCFDHDQNKRVSIMIRAKVHRLMWTLFIAKHVLFAIRLIILRPNVNTAWVIQDFTNCQFFQTNFGFSRIWDSTVSPFSQAHS